MTPELIITLVVSALMVIFALVMQTKDVFSSFIFKVMPVTMAVALLWTVRAPLLIVLSQ